ncbi:MAG: ABC transporter permease [Solirubrobacteraceae bacterium]
MSAIAAPQIPSVSADRRADPRPDGARLTAVELRKMLDTRAGFWLPLGIAAITAITGIVTMLSGTAPDHTFRHVLDNALLPEGLLLPVMGVLLVTGEWSQRTALTTFTLVPGRSRVLGAKLGAAVIVSVVALALGLAVSAIAVAVGSGGSAGTWSLAPVMIPQAFAYLATAMITGVAFGAAVMISAPAIVAYLILPTAWNALAGGVHALHHVATWLDSSRSLAPLTSHPLSATEWAHALATLAVWMVLPLLVGWWRLLRHDVG